MTKMSHFKTKHEKACLLSVACKYMKTIKKIRNVAL